MSSPTTSRFQKFLADVSSVQDPLPLVHTTSAFSFSQMLSSDSLAPSQCKHFGKEILYLFYGRPAYRTQDSNHSGLEFNWPVVFIIDPNKIESIAAVYPFDTGAFFNRLYREFFHKDTKIGSLELPPRIESAQQIVGAFYSSNKEYVKGRSGKNVDIPPMNFEAQGVHEMARLPAFNRTDSGIPVRDERSSSIEVQTESKVVISDAVLAMILPQPYADIPEVIESIARWKITKLRTYSVTEFLNPGSWIAQIYGDVSAIYKELGFLS